MIYVLDTNILLHTLRESLLSQQIDRQFAPYSPQHEAIISTVSIGEIYSLAKRNRWGKTRMYKVRELIDKVKAISVEGELLMECYADIDAFSQSNHPTMQISGSARKMGKNDLWIAATTAIVHGKLLTTDGDFFHLHNTFFPVEYIDPESYRNI